MIDENRIFEQFEIQLHYVSPLFQLARPSLVTEIIVKKAEDKNFASKCFTFWAFNTRA